MFYRKGGNSRAEKQKQQHKSPLRRCSDQRTLNEKTKERSISGLRKLDSHFPFTLGIKALPSRAVTPAKV